MSLYQSASELVITFLHITLEDVCASARLRVYEMYTFLCFTQRFIKENRPNTFLSGGFI